MKLSALIESLKATHAHVQNSVTSGIKIMVTTPLPTQTTTSSSSEVRTVLTVAKFASGKTQPGATKWQRDTSSVGDGIYVDVDTSAAGFAQTPIYVTSIGGDSYHWGVTGASAVYKPTPTGFRVEIRWDKGFRDDTSLTPELANGYKWHINWIAFEPFSQEGQGSNGQTSPTTTQKTPFPILGKDYRFINKNSGLALETYAGKTEDGAKVDQYKYTGYDEHQKWQFQDAGDGYFYIVNKKTTKVLQVSGGKKEDSTIVDQWTKQNVDHHKWRLEDAGDGYFYLVAKHSGKTVHVQNASTASEAPVVQFQKGDGNNSKWKIEAV